MSNDDLEPTEYEKLVALWIVQGFWMVGLFVSIVQFNIYLVCFMLIGLRATSAAYSAFS